MSDANENSPTRGSCNPKGEDEEPPIVEEPPDVVVDEDEMDYVPDDEENSMDDEGTLEEEEGLENELDIADEMAALQEEKDIPVEDLMRRYGYGNQGGPSNGAVAVVDQGTNHPILQESLNDTGINNNPSATSSSPRVGVIQNAMDVGNLEAENGQDDDSRSRGEHGYFSTSDEDSEDDNDYIPDESWKREIKIGPEYQAEVPNVAVSVLDDIDDSGDEQDELVWCPNTTRMDENAVEVYLKSAYQSERAVILEERKLAESKLGPGEYAAAAAASSTRQPGRGTWQRKGRRPSLDKESQHKSANVYDDEVALKLLLESNYDVGSALAEWKHAVAIRKHRELDGIEEIPWTTAEQDTFEEGLKVYGKNFRLIRQVFLPSRSIGELVHYYYLWKRTERHDAFEDRYRLQKDDNDYGQNYMDNYLDALDIAAATAPDGTPLPAASAFQQVERQQQQYLSYHQSPNQHQYMSLLGSSNSRIHTFSSQSQKTTAMDETVITQEINVSNNVDELPDIKNHNASGDNCDI